MDDRMHDALGAKAQVLRDLDTLVVSRLFGNGPWLVDAETGRRISRKLSEMGLEEVVSDDGRTTRVTAFGIEQHLDLQMVFMGMWDPGTRSGSFMTTVSSMPTRETGWNSA